VGNGLQLKECGYYEVLYYQPNRNFYKTTKLDLTAEPPLLGRCCYAMFLSLLLGVFIKAVALKNSPTNKSILCQDRLVLND
jgi:hypothetical protein